MISRILILTGVIAVVHGTFLCPPYEIISVLNCEDNCSGISRKCTPGLECTCILGFSRDKSGKCVPHKKCCTGQNEEYCESGSDRTCDDISTSLRTIIFHPPKNGKCFCKKGTVRNSEGVCIPEKKCPRCKGANEVYNPKGCDTKCNLKGVSIALCIQRSDKCICKPGYARQNIDDRDCIPQNECQCDLPHECYLVNGGCEKDCKGNNCLECPGRPGCYCHEGYVRDLKSQKCILPKQCKKECNAGKMLMALARK